MLGFCNNNQASKEVELLHEMDKRNILPDASTVSTVVDFLSKESNYWEYINLIRNFLPKAKIKDQMLQSRTFWLVTDVKDVSSLVILRQFKDLLNL